MINISQDPARRIRRIQRLGDKPAEEYMKFVTPTPDEFERAELPSQFKIRFLRGNRLAKRYRLASAERDWLCLRSTYMERDIVMVYASLDSNTELLHRARLRAITERGVLNDVKVWASEQLRAAERTIAEQKERIEDLEKRLAKTDRLIF
jgi:uncharacterized protein YydD (DUF2326 family)